MEATATRAAYRRPAGGVECSFVEEMENLQRGLNQSFQGKGERKPFETTAFT